MAVAERALVLGGVAALVAFLGCSGGGEAASGSGGSAGATAVGGSSAGMGGSTGGPPAPPPSLGGAPVVVVVNGGAGGNAECVRQQVRFEPELPNVMLLIDGSNSMTLDFGGTSRWDAVKEALIADGTGLIATLESRVRFGLTMYFSSAPIGQPETPCPALVQVPVALDNARAVAASFENTRPIGATPTGESIEKVWPALAALDAGKFRGPRMLVLATDGEPSGCDVDAEQGRARSKSAVKAAHGAGISTFVIGVGPEASDQHLRELANLGQGHAAEDATDRFFRVLDTQALAGALATITGDVEQCVFGLNGTVSAAMASSGTVTLNGVELEFQDPDGWHLEDESRLSLDGSACESLQSSGAGTLDISFPCGAFIPS